MTKCYSHFAYCPNNLEMIDNSNKAKYSIKNTLLLFAILVILTTKTTEADDSFLLRRRKLQVDKGYKYNEGNCPNDGKTGLACPPSNLGAICDKGNTDVGSFMECWNACKPSYCCATDTPESTNFMAPSCSEDENCAGYGN